MVHRDIVVIGASAGGLEALKQILSALPAELDAAILIVLHTSSSAIGLLPIVLQRSSSLPVCHPKDGEPIKHGRVYVAQPGFHMIVEEGVLRVIQGPRENLHRPAIDPLFRSAAAAYGARVIGVILTGMLDDGTSGLMVVKSSGGEAIVQDPESALFPPMPRSAIDHVPNAQVASLERLPSILLTSIHEPLAAGAIAHAKPLVGAAKETRIAELDMNEISNNELRMGHPSAYGCPDCGGVLWEIEENGFLRFRCRVGHAMTAKYLAAEQRHVLETALWAALRAMEESSALQHRMAERAAGSRNSLAAQLFKERASTTELNARVLREFLLQVNVDSEPGDQEGPPSSVEQIPAD